MPTKTRLFKYIKNFTPKTEKFQIKETLILSFHISFQNKDFAYSLEPPRRVPTIYDVSRNKTNNGYPCESQFYYVKVGFKGVKII